MDNYISVLKKYAVFGGRARRKEYWMFFLFNVIIAVIFGVLIGLSSVIGLRALGGLFTIIIIIYGLAVLLPSLGVSVRRLHDTGRSAWWLLLVIVPAVIVSIFTNAGLHGSLMGLIRLIYYVCEVVFIVLLCLDSQPGENQYGPNPKQITINSTPNQGL
ncbi:MAG: DUF805 domain-containing protein [Firmicutes bacterium]|nr:DUF805 domain-containing protein [Bacillota bacterium]